MPFIFSIYDDGVVIKLNEYVTLTEIFNNYE